MPAPPRCCCAAACRSPRRCCTGWRGRRARPSPALTTAVRARIWAAATPRSSRPTTPSRRMLREAEMDCSFCAEFTCPGGGGRIITRDGDWVLLPTLGCFVAGYCLLMPIDHLQAAADLPAQELHALEARIERIRHQIAGECGATIVAEHGPGACDLGASCCTHAHLHLIPIGAADAVTDAYQHTGGAPQVLDGLADLRDLAGSPYLYLSPQPGVHLAWPAAGFPRQFVRRVCAGILGMPDRYDWRDHPFEPTMLATLTRLRTALQPPAEPQRLNGHEHAPGICCPAARAGRPRAGPRRRRPPLPQSGRPCACYASSGTRCSTPAASNPPTAPYCARLSGG